MSNSVQTTPATVFILYKQVALSLIIAYKCVRSSLYLHFVVVCITQNLVYCCVPLGNFFVDFLTDFRWKNSCRVWPGWGSAWVGFKTKNQEPKLGLLAFLTVFVLVKCGIYVLHYMQGYYRRKTN